MAFRIYSLMATLHHTIMYKQIIIEGKPGKVK